MYHSKRSNRPNRADRPTHADRLQKISDAVGGTVTKLKPTRADPMRLSILIDKKVIATLPRPRIDEFDIKVGIEWTPRLAGLVTDAVDADKAYRRALHHLARRAHGSAELADKLRRKEHTSTAIEITIARLTNKGWLDDLDFARTLAREETRKGNGGPRRLRHKLFQKRIPADLIDQIVAEHTDGRDLIEDARKVALKKLRTAAMKKADPATRRRRLWGLLGRRGFEAHTIHALLDNLPELTEDSQMF